MFVCIRLYFAKQNLQNSVHIEVMLTIDNLGGAVILLHCYIAAS